MQTLLYYNTGNSFKIKKADKIPYVFRCKGEPPVKFGMPTLVECPDLRACMILCRQLGLDFVEINMSFPQYLPNVLNIKELRRLQKESGAEYTLHLDEQLNPFDFNEKIANAYEALTCDSIRLSKKLGIRRLNMHLPVGVYVTLPDKRIYLSDTYWSFYEKKVLAFARMCQRETEATEILLCIENTDSLKTGWTEAHRKAIDILLSHSCFGLTLDTGHEIITEFRDRTIFEKHQEKLCHIHLHDATKTKGPHLPLGEGIVDIPAMLNLASEKDATCLIEVKTVAGLKSSVAYLHEHGFLPDKMSNGIH